MGRPAGPIRLVHLGLGNFFRSHQAWYTDRVSDAEEWSYTAFSGRSNGIARVLEDQGCLYTLAVRSPDEDRLELVSSISEAHSARDYQAWLASLSSQRVAAVTITVTEAGYCANAAGGLDFSRADVARDIERLRADLTEPVVTTPARLVAGLAARQRADAGPITLISCDNLAGNAALTSRIVGQLAEFVDPSLSQWIAESVAVAGTVVDRITPRTTDEDLDAVSARAGYRDEAVVVTEPFSEWVISGAFPAGRPKWEDAGAVFANDVTDYEHRKLWLLNGAHSLLAYAGSMRGHRSVPQAIADEKCLSWVQQWWNEARRHLPQSAVELDAYSGKLLERFSNTKISDRLERVAEDGSRKIPVRVLPVVQAERSAGRVATGATRILAAWICHLRGLGAPIHDVDAPKIIALAQGALQSAVPNVLFVLDPELASDSDVVATVTEQCIEVSGLAGER
ncbi:MAG: mannitol dehydrogenase family protein [Acidimicrobiales bacterium]